MNSRPDYASLSKLDNCHPYEYLRELNNLYATFDRCHGKDYSQISKIKLPEKRFKQKPIPKCFEEAYILACSRTAELTKADEQNSNAADEKFWKQHREIIQKHKQSVKISSANRLQRHSSMTRMSNTDAFSRRGSVLEEFAGTEEQDCVTPAGSRVQDSITKARPNTAGMSRTVAGAVPKNKTQFLLNRIMTRNGKEYTYDNEKLKLEVINRMESRAVRSACSKRPQTAVQCGLKKSVINRSETNLKKNIIPKQADSSMSRKNQSVKINQYPQMIESTAEETPKVVQPLKQSQYLSDDHYSAIIQRFKNSMYEVDQSITAKSLNKATSVLEKMRRIVEEQN